MSKKNSQVYVSRFSRSTGEDDLNDNFKQFGKIREISMKNGYAFIEFDDYRDAEEAVDRMDGKNLDGHKLIVEMAGANKKGKKTSSSRGARGPQPGDKCFNCGKTGHWANECRESKGRRRRSYSSKSRSDSRSSSSSRDRKKKHKNSKKSKNRSRSRSDSRSKSKSRSKRHSSKSRSDRSSKSKSRSKSSDRKAKKGNGDGKKEEEPKVSKEEETNKEKDN